MPSFAYHQRSRSDTLKKQEVSKKDAEEKVAYLLQQLKSAENKISRMETLAARGETKQRSSIIEDQATSTGSSTASTTSTTTTTIHTASPAIAEPVKVVKKMGDVTVSTSTVTSTSSTVVTPRGQPEKEAHPIQEIKTVLLKTVPTSAPVPVPVPVVSQQSAVMPPVPPSKVAVDTSGLGVAGSRLSANKYSAFVSGSPLKEGEATQELNKELKDLKSQMKSPAP